MSSFIKRSFLKIKAAKHYFFTMIRWIFLATLVGCAGGMVGTAFHKSIEYVTSFREVHSYIIWFLPLGGLAIVALYKVSGMTEDTGTNLIFNAVHTDEKVPAVMAPVIFISTIITHFVGGSAGREGAALQLGGSISYTIGRFFHLSGKDMHIITLSGMSGVFAALFGTPITATFFAMEVISVGLIYYSALIPCITASLVAYVVSLYFDVPPVRYLFINIPVLSGAILFKTVIVAILCAGVSILFCLTLHKTKTFMKFLIPNEYLRISVGGLLIILLTYLVQTNAYNGAGMDVISQALTGYVAPEAFLLKILFTSITLAAGFKGGEIVPTFFIGATFGGFVASILGLDPGFGAAIGLISVFCGVVNTPITSILLSIELFGSQGILLFAVSCSITNLLSGNYGLYHSQKLMYSKLKAEYINIRAK